MNSYILELKNLCKYFPVKKGLFSRKTDYVRAVDNLSLSVKKFETLRLIGESGCGKSTLARTILRLIEPTSGNILFDSKNLLSLGPKETMKFRQNMQIVYQDPFLSLNPQEDHIENCRGTVYNSWDNERPGFPKTRGRIADERGP